MNPGEPSGPRVVKVTLDGTTAFIPAWSTASTLASAESEIIAAARALPLDVLMSCVSTAGMEWGYTDEINEALAAIGRLRAARSS